MKRQGWPFCLGLLVCGAATAQPPLNTGHLPPPADLPGVVIAQTQGTHPPPVAVEMPVAPAFPDGTPLPGVPVSTGGQTIGMPVPTGEFASHGHKGDWERKWDWLMYRSRARQSGHYWTPYTPPLQAWFPCDPRRGACAPPCAVPMTTAVPGSTLVAPGPDVPLPPQGLIPVPPQVSGPTLPTAPEGDVLLGFKKVGPGLNFAPGVAPMSGPTTQIHRVSHWRPK